MHRKKFSLGIFITLISSSTLAQQPHFYLQLENRSDKDTTVSFEKGIGNVFLEPTLAPQTPLNPHKTSGKYEVHIEPLDPKDTFNIIFTGKQTCQFNVAFYAPANPKITVEGPGCYGGGYQIIDNGYTLLLYVSDIHIK